MCFFPESYGVVATARGAEFGKGTGPIFLDGIQCNGNERNLLDCSRIILEGAIGQFKCASDHSQDAGVRCPGQLHVVYFA